MLIPSITKKHGIKNEAYIKQEKNLKKTKRRQFTADSFPRSRCSRYG